LVRAACGENQSESGDQLGIRAAAVDISLFLFTKIFLSADDVPHECRRRRRERKAHVTTKRASVLLSRAAIC
jgi:hypothetical protein